MFQAVQRSYEALTIACLQAECARSYMYASCSTGNTETWADMQERIQRERREMENERQRQEQERRRREEERAVEAQMREAELHSLEQEMRRRFEERERQQDQ